MWRIAPTAIVCSLLVGVLAEGQTLSEIARRERARRNALLERGRVTRVLELPGLAGPQAEPTGGRPDMAETSIEDRHAMRGFAPETGGDLWSDVYREYLARFRSVSNELDRLGLEDREVCGPLEAAQSKMLTGGSPNEVVPTAQEDRCSLIPGELARLRLERAQLERDCREDARRRGILPGRARLRR